MAHLWHSQQDLFSGGGWGGHTQIRWRDRPTAGEIAAGRPPWPCRRTEYPNDLNVTAVHGRHRAPYALKIAARRGNFQLMSEQTPQIEPAPAPIYRGWRGYVRKRPRTIVAPARIGVSPYGRALDWFLPWQFHDYPGKGKGARELHGGTVTTACIRSWVSGRRKPPAVACDVLLAAIDARIAAGIAARKALRAYRDAREKHRGGVRGLQRIDPVTGLDGRSRTGRRGKRAEREL